MGDDDSRYMRLEVNLEFSRLLCRTTAVWRL